MCRAESSDGMAARGGVKKMQSTMNRVADAYFSLSLYWDHHQPVLCFLDTIKRRKSQTANIKFFLFLLRLTASQPASQPSVIYSLYCLYLFIYLFISSSSSIYIRIASALFLSFRLVCLPHVTFLSSPLYWWSITAIGLETFATI